MAIHKHNDGQLYCDASDLERTLGSNALYHHLSRARKRGGGTFQNIVNPFYNNKNSKRWVLLNSIPPELRKQLETSLWQAGLHQENALLQLQKDDAPAEEIVTLGTLITSEAVLVSQPAICKAIEGHLDETYRPHLEAYFLQGHAYEASLRYARTCALVSFIYEQESIIHDRCPDKKEQRLHLRSLHTNLLALLAAEDLKVAVPKSHRRYLPWWEKVSKGITEGHSLAEVVTPLRADNQNTRKLHEVAQQYLRFLYVTGPALPARQIYKHLLTHAQDQGWWQTKKGFCAPSYRTVARFLESSQADLAQARQGDGAVFAHYLPQISRSLPTEKNAIWGIDGTAHNELVFYNGRTRQYVYGVYTFDYASGKLLACAPYNTAANRGQGERAEHYIEALSEAIRSTGSCPQVLQLDRGPAFQEVKKWCELRGIKVVPAGVKNARAKLVELLLGRLQNLLIRYLEGWSGQNRTASGLNAHPSPEQLAQHAKAAPSAAEAMAWMRTKQLEEYNRIPFEILNGKPCGKNPDELWAALLPACTPLPEQQVAMYAGRCHRVKFTKAGLTVRHEQEYIYYPDVSSKAAREAAVRAFSELKTRSPEGSKRTLYVLDYTKGAYVFDKSWDEGGKYLGYWPPQQKVSMLETLGGKTSQHFRDKSELQRNQKERMKEAGKAAKEWTPLNKERLQSEELKDKQPIISDKEIDAYRKKHYERKVHPLTGEVEWLPKKNF